MLNRLSYFSLKLLLFIVLFTILAPYKVVKYEYYGMIIYNYALLLYFGVTISNLCLCINIDTYINILKWSIVNVIINTLVSIITFDMELKAEGMYICIMYSIFSMELVIFAYTTKEMMNVTRYNEYYPLIAIISINVYIIVNLIVEMYMNYEFYICTCEYIIVMLDID